MVSTSGPTRESSAQPEKLVANPTSLGLPRLNLAQGDSLSENTLTDSLPSELSNRRSGARVSVSQDATTQTATAVGGASLGTGAEIDTASTPSNPLVSAVTQYQPREIVQLADPSNYGERFIQDINGNAVNNEYIVVLHETVGSATSALNTFGTYHSREADQVSYHSLITLDGTVVYVVPPEQRAFGAGDSVFISAYGEESVLTHAGFPSSVNNFAYHISLETPLDGQNNNARTHSGYTESQYQSLAWLLARTNIPDDRITTHEAVDRSGSRMDPRSFEADRMYRLLRQYESRQTLR